MAEKTEAQRLAELLESYGWPDAAAELLRLEAVNAQLLEALEMGYADTMDYIKRNHLSGAENNHWIVAARAAIAAAKGEA